MRKSVQMCLTGRRGAAYPGGMAGKTLTLAATARYLGYSRRSLYNMLNDGRFSVPPIPGTQPRRWNVEALDAWRLGEAADMGAA
jgi:predicted DNA-binding transcriptional regulator AlpA